MFADGQMADFHRRARLAPQQLAGVHAAAPDACAGKHAQQRARALARAEAVFAVGARVHVVRQRHAAAEPARQQLAQRHSFPAQVRRFENDPRVEIQHAGTPHPDARQRARRHLRFFQRLVDRLADPRQHRLGAFIDRRLRLRRGPRLEAGAVDGRHHLRAAQIEPHPDLVRAFGHAASFRRKPAGTARAVPPPPTATAPASPKRLPPSPAARRTCRP